MQKNFIYIIILISISLLNAKEFSYQEIIDIFAKESPYKNQIHKDKEILFASFKENKKLDNPEFELHFGNGTKFEEEGNNRLRGFGLSMKIPNPIELHLKNKKLKFEYESSLKNNESQSLKYFYEIKEKLFILEAEITKLKILEEKISLAEKVVQINKLKANVGEGRNLDFLISQGNLERLKGQLNIQSILIEEIKNSINIMCAYKLGKNFDIKLPIIIKKIKNSNNIKKMVSNTPLIQSVSKHLESLRMAYKESKLKVIPPLSLGYSKSREMDGNVWSIGLGLEIPIFNSKLNNVKLEKYRLQNEELKTKILLQNLENQLSSRLKRVNAMEKKIANLNEFIVKNGKKNLGISWEMYKTGEISYRDLFFAHESYYELVKEKLENELELKILISKTKELIGEK